MPGLRFGLLAPIVVAALLTACGGGDDSGLPSNWHRFTEGEFAGAIHSDWTELYVDATTVDDGGLELPDSVSTAFDAFVAAGNTSVFFVYLEQAPTNDFVTYITILSCEPPEVTDIVSDPVKLVQYYESVKVPAEQHAVVAFQDKDFVILKLEVAPDYDTYQVYVESEGCYLPVTLNTRKGETFWLDAFGTFVNYLRPDVASLREQNREDLIDATPTPQP